MDSAKNGTDSGYDKSGTSSMSNTGPLLALHPRCSTASESWIHLGGLGHRPEGPN